MKFEPLPVVSRYWIRIAIGLARWVSGPGGSAFLNLEVVGDKGQVVVVTAVAVVDGEGADGNGVESGVLACHATQSTGEGIRRNQRTARDCVRERCRIGIAVDLELSGIGRDFDCTFVDGQRACAVARVEASAGRVRGFDRVRTSICACRQCVTHAGGASHDGVISRGCADRGEALLDGECN